MAIVYVGMYRGFRYPLLTMAALLAGTFWAMGWLALTIGHLNILSNAFAVMLIGMGDYGVLILTHYEDDLPGRPQRIGCDAIGDAVAGPSILTAAVGTALAFFAAMFADFTAVAELGWIAGWGVFLCAFACFTVLPALIVLPIIGRRSAAGCRSSRPRANASSRPSGRPNRKGARPPGCRRWRCRPRWVLAAGMACLAVLGVFTGRVGYDHNLLHMQADGLESVQWEQKLILRMAGAQGARLLSVANTPQEMRALSALSRAVAGSQPGRRSGVAGPGRPGPQARPTGRHPIATEWAAHSGSTITPFQNAPRDAILRSEFSARRRPGHRR